MKYRVSHIKVEEYWNGYRPFYIHSNGNKELLAVAKPTRKLAMACAREQIKYLNGKESM